MASAELRTARLRLRPPVASDAQWIFESYGSDPEATRYIWATHTHVDETRAYLDQTLGLMAEGKVAAWVIEADGEPAGMISARGIDGSKVNLGYVLAKPFWGRGIATEASRVVIAALFELEQVHRVQAFCDVDNPGSARVMQKAGMEREGLLRRFGFHPNVSTTVPRDVYVYSAVRGD